MSHPTRPTPPSLARFFLLLLAVLIAVGGLTIGLAQAQKGKEEEEEKAPAPAKTKPRPKVEEEDTAPAKPTRRVSGPEDDGKKPAKGGLDDLADLTVAARKAKNKAVKEFLDKVAVPHDRVVNPRIFMNVTPVEKYLGAEPPHFAGKETVRPLDDDWHEGRPMEVTSGSLTGVFYYEQLGLQAVNDFLQQPLDRNPPNTPGYVSRQDMLRYAEAALAFVQRFHESAAAQGKREGDEFDRMEAAVKKRQLEIQLQELDNYVDASDWDNAFALANRLADAYPNREDHEQIATLIAKVIGRAAQAGNFNDQQLLDLQGRLRQLEDRFPNAGALAPINDRLKNQANDLFTRARDIVEKDPKRKEEALDMLRRAERVWPRLSGLRDYRLNLENALAVLRVGVRDLPVNLSPNLATTDAEKQAVELMFEGLVRLSYDPDLGQYYAPGLTEGLPTVVPLGRQFHIAHDAFWSNDKPVTAADVRNTLKLLKNPRWSGCSPAWRDLVENVREEQDPSRVTVTFTQGMFDPLALLTFKVLPAEPWPNHGPLTSDDEPNFAKQPVGSGPYQLAETGTADGRAAVTFVASASYGSRAGKAGLPHIRQVRFVKCDDPPAALLNGEVDLVTDVPADRLDALQKASSRLLILPRLPNRRIYFLAANYRRTALQNASLRRALAHAIDREKILDACYRGGQKDMHKALNGPFPTGSWAWNSDPQLAYRTNSARAFWKEADQAAAVKELSLKYPSDDPHVEQAMKLIQSQLKTELGATVKLEPLPPRALREKVEANHDYDLAYYHYDYPSDAFALWPLFDPDATGPRQSNFLGYENDGELQQELRTLASYRNPEEVQKAARRLHEVFFKQKMPFIPLWQLDTNVAMSRSVEPQPATFDPLLVFTDIDQWLLQKK